LLSTIILLTPTIEGKDSFKLLGKPQLRDALCSKISFNPSKLVCLFSDISNTICLNIKKSGYLLVNKGYLSKCGKIIFFKLVISLTLNSTVDLLFILDMYPIPWK